MSREHEPVRARRIDFDRVSAAARRNADAVVAAFLPDGCRSGVEWTARNPKRPDKTLGSFRVNLASGKWADFAGDVDARGSDLVGLVAYLLDLSQRDAAIALASSLGIDAFE